MRIVQIHGIRLFELLCNKEIFEKAIPPYTDALNKCGFKENLVFTPKNSTNNIIDRKRRKRKAIWFNPPCSVNVKTNISKIFLSFLKKNFSKKNQVKQNFR